MYCPLCDAEYRQGFTTCSDCHTELVATLEGAEAARMRFWRGTREEKLARILGALGEGQIPYHYKEIAKGHLNLRILGIPIGGRKPLVQIEYEIWIFRRDLERSRQAVAEVLRAGETA